MLPTLDIPIHILHGVSDANAPVEGVYEIEAAFAALGKTNLDARTYPGHDPVSYTHLDVYKRQP